MEGKGWKKWPTSKVGKMGEGCKGKRKRGPERRGKGREKGEEREGKGRGEGMRDEGKRGDNRGREWVHYLRKTTPRHQMAGYGPVE